MQRSLCAVERSFKLVLRLGLVTAALAACDAHGPRNANRAGASSSSAFYAAKFERQPSAAALTELGRMLFFDSTLSASGRMSCASCHDPAHAWGPPNSRAVQLGGIDLKTPGVRAVPSLRYQQDAPPFSEHFADDDDNDGVDQGPAGGRDWDGRASSAHEQARAPLLSPFEMANNDSTAVVTELNRSTVAPRFRDAFGEHLFSTPALAWTGLLMALEVFQQSPADFYPYSSKYDEYLRGKAKLTAAERHGLALFNDPAKGNCAQCHPSAMQRGAFPQFTDRGFVALGVPRNSAIPANRDPAYFDLGLCGPLRRDLVSHHEYCGMFKTPTLRNVAVRTTFFHNGVFRTLDEVLRFYQRRDTTFDDLPPAYRRNVSADPPLNRGVGAAPRFTDRDALDIIAFLRTLTDGYAR
jgi:cytochrome c peroxidase